MPDTNAVQELAIPPQTQEKINNQTEPSGKAKRVELIKQLEQARGGTNIITFITGTRMGLDFPIAMDSIRKIYDHLKRIKEKGETNPKIDLFIHSNGGDGTVPWKLVTLIREYTKNFTVLIPHKAFSAATLVSLGADSIVMHPMGILGPTDPTVKNEYNPPHPIVPNELLGISVEDVSAYVNLIKEDFGINHEEELVQVIKILAEKIHPLALGNVKRFHAQSRMLAKKLLRLHIKETSEDHKIERIVDNLNSKLFFHGHPINRKEAKNDLDLKVEEPDATTEALMWKLYLEYENEMLLDQPFTPMDEFMQTYHSLPPAANAIMDLQKNKGVYIESVNQTDVFTVNFQMWGQKANNGTTQTQLIRKRSGWEVE